MDEDTRRSIAGIEVTAIRDEGVQIGAVSKIRLVDKLRALELLGRHVGLTVYRSRVEKPEEDVHRSNVTPLGCRELRRLFLASRRAATSQVAIDAWTLLT
jgi:hypothetical protein